MHTTLLRGGLFLRRLSPNNTITTTNKPPPFQYLRSFCARTQNSMAEKEAKTKTQTKEESKSEERVKELQEKPKKKELPPPPEKPLPGDCCGSGCVQCVWDLYYEELEAYNKLCETDDS